MDNAQQQIVERLKEATNVLVTTSSNPTVDQLAAVIGLTLLLNKANKHATAVFSGEVPSTLEFLQPEKTLEKNTDSLRDFIISLDKSKADKLRYKVEDSHVKIFITPYRTSISDKDLEFSQGDFNVDLVILLGVHEQKDLDQAITAHGRILHDATVASVANTPGNNLGAINWVDTFASSLCEMLVGLSEQVKADGLDGQISTAFMTGIVAETDRFSNEKTTATTMATSARLMATGANQQLVATELMPKPEPVVAPVPVPETPAAQPEATAEKPASEKSDDGSLKVEHTDEQPAAPVPAPTAAPAAPELPELEEEPEEEKLEQIHIDEDGGLHPIAEMQDMEGPKETPETSKDVATETHQTTTEVSNTLLTTPPTLGGPLAASSEPEADSTTDPLSLPPIGGRLLSHDAPLGGTPSTSPEEKPSEEPKATRTEDTHGRITIQPPKHEETVFNAIEDKPEASDAGQNAPLTLGQLEQTVAAQSGAAPTPPHVSEDQAREAVSDAVAESPQPLTPPAAFNSQPLDLDVQGRADAGVSSTSTGFPPNLVPPQPTPPADNTASPVINPMAPPPLPPPMMPPMPGFTQSPTNDQPGSGVVNPQEPPK